MRKFILVVLLIVVGLAIVGVATGLLNVDQVREGRLPTVQGGQLPKFKVDTPDVQVGTVNRVVEVPVVDVTTGAEKAGS